MDSETQQNYWLETMPHFIAVNYRRMLESTSNSVKVEYALRTYDLGLRALTIGLVSQYLTRDRDIVSDSYLNSFLMDKFSHIDLYTWQQLLFATLRAYEGIENRFFMTELYDFYWDRSQLPHKLRTDVESPFFRLTQIAIELKTKRIQPVSESGWAVLAEEVTTLLKQVLDSVSFIANYDLIRVLTYDERQYEYELHKGMSITIGYKPLPAGVNLGQGWFYLRKDNEELLPLHPFLIFWEGTNQESKAQTTDIGVYDKFVYNQLQYLLGKLGRTFTDIDSAHAFFTLLYDTIEEVKRTRERAEKLTWWQLQDTCEEITTLRMATVENKYNRKLYLQRESTLATFKQFLDSPERCFVLLGKSGVGKSNFFLSLRDLLKQEYSDTCVLMYDAANLKVQPSITVSISQDFDKQLVLSGEHIEDIWQEIAKISDIDGRRMLLFVDAINENSNAKELLKQLDELVQSPWSWLKVVFSSRPETWQTIKRGVRLAEAFYYQEDDSGQVGIALEGFSYSEEMQPFTGEELPRAYAKYQEVFHMQTPYEKIPGVLRSILRDPLGLWLVASTYAEQPIPNSVKVIELVSDYLLALQNTGRLYEEDLRLLENQLVPLMVHNDHFTNALTVVDIDRAGEGLYESIFSEQVLSDGKRANQSFLNLLDADILTILKSGRELKIAFKYERFYEHFVGKELYKTLMGQVEWVSQYTTWIASLRESPFLWGAMKSCLVYHISALDTKAGALLQIALAQMGDQRIKELLIAAITEYGYDECDKVESVQKLVLTQHRQWWRRIINRSEMLGQCPAWKNIAIVLASNLGLKDLLGLALIDASPAVRTVAIRHSYILWKKQNAVGFEILESLIAQSTGILGLPLLHIFESFTGLSLLILFDDFHNESTVDRLRILWKQALKRLLWINHEKLGSRQENMKNRVRVFVMRILAAFIVRTASRVPSNSLMNIPEFKHFYRADDNLSRRKEVARLLIQYMNTEKTDIDTIRDELLSMASERDLIIALLATATLQRHLLDTPDKIYRLVHDLFHESLKVKPLGPFAGVVPNSVLNLNPQFEVAEATSLMNEFTTTMQERNLRGEKWTSHLREYRYTSLEMLCWTKLGQRVDTELLPAAQSYLQKIIAKNDYEWIKELIEWDATALAIEWGYPRLALSIVKPLFAINEQSIQLALIELLSRMRLYYTDEIDNFMEINQLDDQIIALVRRHIPSEDLGDLLNYRGLIFWQDAIILGSTGVFWQKLTWLWNQIPQQNSFENFVVVLMKFTVNEIYGKHIFPHIADTSVDMMNTK